MIRKIFYLLTLILLFITSFQAQSKFDENGKYLIIRCDDFGMCHSVNMAIKEIIEAKIPISVSVMFTCPWWEEAVEILKEHPEVSVGIHLTLNSEWKNYRWGPIMGKEIVPSLVDSVGMFFPSRSKLFANNPKLNEFELEITAQVERAFKSGVKIDYIDHHMGAAVQTIEMREIVEKLAKENRLGIPNYFNENYSSITYSPKIPYKLDSLIARLEKIQPGTINLQVMHVGLDTDEMSALVDLNPGGLKEMSKHREGELRTLLSPKFTEAIKENNIILITYRQLIEMLGLESMKRPKLDDY